MTGKDRDPALDVLLALDGEVLVVDPAGKHWVKFRARRVDPSPERPHGLSYSLALHDKTGERLVGFDNAHPVRTRKGPSGRRRRRHDHAHRRGSVRTYD